jgi:hypothetical protein
MPGIPLRNPVVENDARGKVYFKSGLHREHSLAGTVALSVVRNSVICDMKRSVKPVSEICG